MTVRSLISRVFECHHRRLTFPITLVRTPGGPSSSTYVVCLDCGKHLVYHWDTMKTGKVIEQSSDAGGSPQHVPSRPKKRLKYALIGSGLSFAVLLGKKLVRSHRVKTPPMPQSADNQSKG